MTPSIDLRIASMVRAMKDVIAPAIDPANSLAREQSALMIGQLHMISAQWRLVSRYASVCLADMQRLVAGLAIVGGARTTAAGDRLTQVLAEPASDTEAQYQDAARALEGLVRAADEDGTDAFRQQLRREALQFSIRQAERDRVWFAMSGFDMDADHLPSIEQILDAAQ